MPREDRAATARAMSQDVDSRKGPSYAIGKGGVRCPLRERNAMLTIPRLIARTGCATCDAIGWIEEIHPGGELARILPCPEHCAEGRLMDELLPPCERGWYLRDALNARPTVPLQRAANDPH